MDKIRTGIAIVLTAVAAMGLWGCRQNEVGDSPPLDKSDDYLHSEVAEYVEGEELLCLASSEEEAGKIAEMYGIELVSFSYGVATFHTDGDPQAIIEYGTEQGYPELELNGYGEIN